MKKTNLHLWRKLSAGLTILAVISFFLSSSLIMTGCQKKQEQPQQTTDTTKTDTTANKSVDTTKKVDTTNKGATSANAPDIKGTWTGQFDKRATTLKINEVNGNQFKGTIRINYREVINQQVSGTIDPATKKITMKDLLHSRYQGKYSGKLSDDMKKLSGTFTMDLDGTKFNFSLAKK